MTQARIDRMQAEVQIIDHGKLLALTVAAAAVVILLGVTGMTSPELTASEAETRPQAGSDFVYFPSLYVNQATEASEHVQAF
jgi:hypothetical protein